MAVVDLQDVREAGNLITLDEAMEVLKTTEPLNEYSFALDGSDDVSFNLPNDWMEEAGGEPDTFVTSASVKVNGTELSLTKESLLSMATKFGLTGAYVKKTPGSLIEPQLNWWVKNGGVAGTDGMRILSKDHTALAFIKSSLSTFPNLPVVETAVDRIKDRFETDELFVDYKMHHDLERTSLRIIVPNHVRTIHSKRHSDEKPDNWSLGIQLTNSLMAHPTTKLNVSGYLFAWWCANGAISTHATSGNYNRRVQGQDQEEVLDWVGRSVDGIFTDLDHEIEAIDALTDVSLEGELNDVVMDVLKQFKMPRSAHQPIIDNLIDSDDISGYGLMQAITQTANDPSITDHVRESIMSVGGSLPSTLTDRCHECHRVRL